MDARHALFHDDAEVHARVAHGLVDLFGEGLQRTGAIARPHGDVAPAEGGLEARPQAAVLAPDGERVRHQSVGVQLGLERGGVRRPEPPFLRRLHDLRPLEKGRVRLASGRRRRRLVGAHRNRTLRQALRVGVLQKRARLVLGRARQVHLAHVHAGVHLAGIERTVGHGGHGQQRHQCQKDAGDTASTHERRHGARKSGEAFAYEQEEPAHQACHAAQDDMGAARSMRSTSRRAPPLARAARRLPAGHGGSFRAGNAAGVRRKASRRGRGTRLAR